MDIIMPKMGESINEGTILKWHKKVGDSVKRDEIIFEISTDKVDTEIPSPADGVISEILFNEGATVEVGTVVARLGSGEKQKEFQVVNQKEIVAESDNSQLEKPTTPTQQKISTEPGKLLEITMPKMGESVMEGTIIKWNKKIGDYVKKDEIIFEISTDKVDTEVPSPEAGTLAEILVQEQQTVEVGTVVAKLSVSGEVTIDQAVDKKIEAETGSKPSSITKEPVSMHDNFAAIVEQKVQIESTGENSGFYSPLVLSIAKKEGLSFDELGKIDGSGVGKRLTKKDLLDYLEKRKSMKTSTQQTFKVKKETEKVSHPVGAPAPSFVPTKQPVSFSIGEIEKIPMDNIRLKIMQHMITSRDTSVHVSAMIEVDMTRIYNFIQSYKDDILRSEGIKLTYMPFIALAVVKALKEYPLMNASIDGNNIVKKNFINLGIAVAIEPNGLIVPNIKGAGEKNIIGLAKSINDIANRARNKKLTPDDITNGTFTITNYGVFGTIFGTPIINQPEVAILGVGAVVKRPVVIEVEGIDTIAIKPMMNITLSHDHRLVDGMLGGLFLKHVKETLESFSGI
ncbi:MAG: 2-oxoglutarate dehydrogenase, E2 component, dihydrolipoamide succinyltransferase [Ignavibacteriaceae bacterium]|nr:2-oxoglutarate dehydrogenase, E2 component, dihydrolipoamide succinyltransferase [Ignavibacteriaceae bacterium]